MICSFTRSLEPLIAAVLFCHCVIFYHTTLSLCSSLLHDTSLAYFMPHATLRFPVYFFCHMPHATCYTMLPLRIFLPHATCHTTLPSRIFSCHNTLTSRIFRHAMLPSHILPARHNQSEQKTSGLSSYNSRRQSHASPHHDFCRLSLSPEHTRRPAASGNRLNFQSSAGGRAFSACAVCLGRHPHKVIECTAAKLWDNSHSSVAIRSNTRHA